MPIIVFIWSNNSPTIFSTHRLYKQTNGKNYILTTRNLPFISRYLWPEMNANIWLCSNDTWAHALSHSPIKSKFFFSFRIDSIKWALISSKTKNYICCCCARSIIKVFALLYICISKQFNRHQCMQTIQNRPYKYSWCERAHVITLGFFLYYYCDAVFCFGYTFCALTFSRAGKSE